jgi:2-methylaconitate cis-trans-isomerase PrpF
MALTPVKIPAVYMRGGTSKGVFFRDTDLPADPSLRDRVLLRVLGSPDTYRRQIDGMGGATSSTSKAAIIAPSSRPDSDIDYLVGQIDIDEPTVDYSSNCGNLASAVGPFAIQEGMMPASEGMTEIRIWQANIKRRIIALVPTRDGAPVEDGDYNIDGVALPGRRDYIGFSGPCRLLNRRAASDRSGNGHTRCAWCWTLERHVVGRDASDCIRQGLRPRSYRIRIEACHRWQS